MKYIILFFILGLFFSSQTYAQMVVGTWKISLDATEDYLSPQKKAAFQKTKALKKLFYESIRFVCAKNGVFTMITYVWGMKEETQGRWKLSPDKKKMTIQVEDTLKVLNVVELSNQQMVLKDPSNQEKIQVLVLVPAP